MKMNAQSRSLAVGLMLAVGLSAGARAEDLARMMARSAAIEAVDQGKIKEIRLPKNKAEQSAIEAACLKGPRVFFGWFWPKEMSGPLSQEIPTTWTNYGEVAKDPLTYCRLQVEEYRNAAKTGTVKMTGGAKEAGPHEMEADESMKPQRGSDGILYPRWPKTDKEKAEFKAAIKKGLYPCAKWLMGPELIHERSQITPEVTPSDVGFPDAESYCVTFATQIETYETLSEQHGGR